jgi:glycerol-3-phosphate acyltransferase PlsY
MGWMNSIVAGVLAYLIGSVSFAVLVSRAFHLPDPRSYGSGNPGATNVLRTGRKAAAIVTLLGDAAKGVVAVLLARILGADPLVAAALAAFAVVLGHVFPLYHRFSGGKGVSTSAGVLLALNVWLGVGAIATWLIIAAFFRISSLAALVAATAAPVFTAMLYSLTHPYFFAVLAVSALLGLRHRSNITKLLAGTEDRIGQRASS